MKTWLTALLLLSLSACGSSEGGDISLRLTLRERQQIDTIVSTELRLMRPRMDSICQANFEEEVARATDSIVQRRLEEELRLRARIPLRKSGANE